MDTGDEDEADAAVATTAAAGQGTLLVGAGASPTAGAVASPTAGGVTAGGATSSRQAGATSSRQAGAGATSSRASSRQALGATEGDTDAAAAAAATTDGDVIDPIIDPIATTPIHYTRETTPRDDELIEMNKNCFLLTKKGKPRLPSSAKKAKNDFVSKVIHAVTDSRLTTEQQVLVLHEAMKRKELRAIGVSAGLVIPGSATEVDVRVMDNIRTSIKTARKTNDLHGRPTDDIRSVVQSIVLATLQPPNVEKTEKTPSQQQVAHALGMPLTTYQRTVKAVKDNRVALEYRDRNTIFSQVVKSKGWTKIDSDIRDAVHEWIRKHLMVIESPIMNDMVRIPDPQDNTKTIKTSKLLLSISVRELHNNMVKLLDVAKSPAGDVLISDTKLRQILPKQIRRMSKRHKEMCGCIFCLGMRYYQSDYNRFKKTLLKKLQEDQRMQPVGSNERDLATIRYSTYKLEMQDHPKAKHAVQCIQCKPVSDWDDDDLVHINCAYGWCEMCPVFQLPKTESELTTAGPLISFHSYEKRTVCSFHDILSQSQTECAICNEKQEGEPKGKLSKKTKLTHARLDFLSFFDDHYLPALHKFKQHRFQYILLSKNHTGSDSKDIVAGEVWSQRDFSERLTLQFNHQAQLEYYSGGATISIEGVAVQFFRQGDAKSTMEFHSCFSDGKL